MKVLEHVLRAFMVEPLGVVRRALLVDGARPVPFAFEDLQDQMFQIFKQHAELFPDVVEEGLVSAPFPALLARFELFRASSHAQLNESVIITPHAVTSSMYNICDVFVWVGQRVAHHAAVVATRFTLDVFTQVSVELRAVLSLCSI